VLLSVALHGTGIALYLRKSEAPVGGAAERRDAPVTTSPDPALRIPEKITLNELRWRQQSGEPLIIADVRTDRSYLADNLTAKGAVRLPPDGAARRARELGLDHHATLVLYCA
jgi:hypothetical protein